MGGGAPSVTARTAAYAWPWAIIQRTMTETRGCATYGLPSAGPMARGYHEHLALRICQDLHEAVNIQHLIGLSTKRRDLLGRAQDDKRHART